MAEESKTSTETVAEKRKEQTTNQQASNTSVELNSSTFEELIIHARRVGARSITLHGPCYTAKITPKEQDDNQK